MSGGEKGSGGLRRAKGRMKGEELPPSERHSRQRKSQGEAKLRGAHSKTMKYLFTNFLKVSGRLREEEGDKHISCQTILR